MNAALAPDDDVQMLQDSARRALADAGALDTLTRGDGDAVAMARQHWQAAKAMGWPGLLVAPASGGAGMGAEGLAVLAEEMGAHFFSGPFLATAVLGAAIADLAASHGRMTGLGKAIVDGSIVLAAAALPPRGDWIAREPDLNIESRTGGRISGTRELVEHPQLATHFLALELVRQHGGGAALRAALVPAGAGITLTPRQPLDVSCPIATVRFDDAPVADGDLIAVALDGAALDALLRPLHVAIAAELVGVARSALDRAVAYAKERRQFGQPIGAFQAIKHRLADAFVLVDNARLAVRHAAGTGHETRALATDAVETARVLAADAALKAATDYIQVQGGMGISWESDAHLHLKRARRLAAAFGSSQGFRQAIVDRFIASVLAQSGPGPACDAG